MAKVITFSRQFPPYHPNAGKPTYFVEKFWNNWNVSELDQVFLSDYYDEIKFKLNKSVPFEILCNFFDSLNQCKREILGAKLHTIRGGKRFKQGDKFSPRVWSGKPYNSKQIIIAPDTEIVKIYDFKILFGQFYIDGESFTCDELLVHEIAENDGLSHNDFLSWFRYPNDFEGQIICWNNINY